MSDSLREQGNNLINSLRFYAMGGSAGAVKRAALRWQWLSACEGSIPSSRIGKK